MASNSRWVYDAAHSAAGSAAAAAVTSGTVTPTVGDQMIVACLNFTTTKNTAFAITDTGSNPGTGAGAGQWNPLVAVQNPGGGTAIMQAFQRLATAADHAASPFTVTSTASGGSGTETSRIVVELHRVPGFVLLGVDVAGAVSSGSSLTTLSLALTGPAPNVDGDLLAWTMLASSLSNGGVIQILYETPNPPVQTTILATTGLGTPLLLSTANSDTISNEPLIVSGSTEEFAWTWTTARTNSCVIGATFKYRHTAGILPILQRT